MIIITGWGVNAMKKNTERIKEIVRSNFDRSVTLYDRFEERHGLFGELATCLADDCGILPGMFVIDVGCGTGASSFALAKLLGQNGRILGIDFSKEMLEVGRTKSEMMNSNERLEDWPIIEFVLGDAETLEDSVDGGYPIDSILYNATIFLVPDPVISLRSAHAMLKEGGSVGLNYLKGLSMDIKIGDEKSSQDFMHYAREEGLECAPYGRKIVKVELLKDMMVEAGFREVRGGIHNFRMSKQEVWDFYTIPAQSAGLYPKTPYSERLELLRDLLDHFEEEGISEYYQQWGWNVAKK